MSMLSKVFVVLVSAVYASVALGVLMGILPKVSFITFFTIPISLKGVLVTLREYDHSIKLRPVQALTILTHLSTGLLLSLSFYL